MATLACFGIVFGGLGILYWLAKGAEKVYYEEEEKKLRDPRESPRAFLAASISARETFHEAVRILKEHEAARLVSEAELLVNGEES